MYRCDTHLSQNPNSFKKSSSSTSLLSKVGETETDRSSASFFIDSYPAKAEAKKATVAAGKRNLSLGWALLEIADKSPASIKNASFETKASSP